MDNQGHGTIVAGEIAGALDSAGVVGLAYSSQLLVAKVVAADGTIPLKAEAAGIRWAVNQGAKVVNLSFGAVRDPQDAESRLVLQGRGQGGGLRREEGSGRRRRGRERGRGATRRRGRTRAGRPRCPM